MVQENNESGGMKEKLERHEPQRVANAKRISMLIFQQKKPCSRQRIQFTTFAPITRMISTLVSQPRIQMSRNRLP